MNEPIQKLERVIHELILELPGRVSAQDLYMSGYEPRHQTMRKRVGEYEICYNQIGGMFEFAAVMPYDHRDEAA